MRSQVIPLLMQEEVGLLARASLDAKDTKRLYKVWFLCALFHGFAMLLFAFSMSESKKKMSFEVILVNESMKTPKEAPSISSASSKGGGLDEDNDRFQTSRALIPSPQNKVALLAAGKITAQESKKPKNSKLKKALDSKQMKVIFSKVPKKDALSKKQLPQMMPKRVSILPNNDFITTQFQGRKDQIAPVEVKHFKRSQASETPSPEALKKDEAFYVYAWARAVEAMGNHHFPLSPVSQLPLSGRVVLAVDISPEGEVLWIRVVKSSGDEFLDSGAMRIVKLASPFRPFSKKMKKQFSHIRITKPWYFYGQQSKFQ